MKCYFRANFAVCPVIDFHDCSCTCPDFQKQGKNVCCKHILFVVLHVLNGEHLIETLRYRYLTDKELPLLFQATGKIVPKEFMQSPPSSSHIQREFVTIL